MAAPAVKVEGVERLTATLDAAARDLDDLGRVSRDLEASLLPQMQARTPRRTGRLRGSLRATAREAGGVDFGTAVVYGRPIHWGWPARHIAPTRFIYDVVMSSKADVVNVYDNEVERVLGRVKGV